MTRRLYYEDSYLRSFRACVVHFDPGRNAAYLDETAFYPTSGGQLHDTGMLGSARVVDVVDEGERIAHLLDHPVDAGEMECEIDWPRRFDHMQQHTGQHLLSAVAADLIGASTISVHLGLEASTVDLDRAALPPAEAERIEQRVNEVIAGNLPVTISFENADAAEGLRKQSAREGTLRIIGIEGIDRSACGGTHVRSTAEIGPVVIRKLDRMRGHVRVEFVCGGRAVRWLRAERERLLGENQSQAERLAVVTKQAARLSLALAQARGRELYHATVPRTDGIRVAVRRYDGAIGEDDRAEAQSFVNAGDGRDVYIGVAFDPPAVLVAGPNAGERLKTLLAEFGGRGGGNAQIAQGSLPAREAAEEVAERIAKDGC
jgi:alanyl-tRNA synthetase